jgi:hypothetical protein
MGRALLFYPTRKTPNHVDDAAYFRRNAEAAARLWMREQGVTCLFQPFDNGLSEPQRRAAIRAAFAARAAEGADVVLVAFFCHGWSDGFQAGYDRAHAAGFVDLLKSVANPASTILRVVFYACSTASDRFGHDGDNSFADRVRDTAAAAGLRIQLDAHTTPGDATENPHLRRLDPDAGAGGALLVDPSDDHAVALLATSWRFRFPWRTRGEIAADVGAAGRAHT